jgi:hypothetical protein
MKYYLLELFPAPSWLMVRPRRIEARKVSVRTIAPALLAFHGLAFLRGGMAA